mmetsp:Transcript_80231/g.186301  ORF Transcript_80231/g.186301 Transcript_80231/m.186301 type:complete len:151 (-) Transcript_80231:105-557(-)
MNWLIMAWQTGHTTKAPWRTSRRLSCAATRSSTWFRSPHGKYTGEMEAVLQRHHLTNTMCDTYASCPIVEDGEWIGQFLARRADHGSIILLHMPELGFREHCFAALGHLLKGLHARNLRVVSIGRLVKLAASKANDFGFDELQRICLRRG